MEVNNVFAKRLRMLREEKRMTQKDISNIVGTTDNAIGNYERGTRMPDAEMLNRLSNIFDVSIDYLLGKTDIRNQYNNQDHSKKESPPKPKPLEDYIKEAETLMLFGDVVDENDKEAILTAIRVAYETAIKKNKEQKKNNK